MTNSQAVAPGPTCGAQGACAPTTGRRRVRAQPEDGRHPRPVPASTVPAGDAGPATPPPERPGGFAATVVAASLLVGGGAGVAGAALWPRRPRRGAVPARTTTASVDQGDTAASGSVEAVATAVLPSVVKIDVTGSQASGSGSGIILTSDGKILTNNHVVEVAGDGGTITVDFNDGTPAKATVLGTDPLTDTAVIKATASAA